MVILRINHLRGKVFEINISKEARVVELKRLVQEKQGYLSADIHFIRRGRQMYEHKYVKDYHLKNYDVVHMVHRVRNTLKLLLRDKKEVHVMTVAVDEKVSFIESLVEMKLKTKRKIAGLTFRGKLLDASANLVEEGVKNLSVVEVVRST
eukprot:snap_masked-scaffold_48-processed-gene-1.96-mRNA-1 protein AED:1.00 eAED:1.00 QI:0/-1/0/0/-1/1/1/0/149